ncbi:MAG: TolC family protein [Pseudomonadota bacterium]
MRRSILLMITAATFVTGCATTSLTGSAQGLSSGLSFELPTRWEQSEDRSSKETNKAAWLAAFDEDDWAMLVEEAYQNNPDLDQLRANLDRANALTDQARASLLPVLDGLVGASRSDTFEGPDASSANLSASLSASWEADLWGRLSSRVEARDFDEAALVSDLEAAKQVLATSVVEAAFLTIESQRLADVSRRNLDALSETLGFVRVQQERGLRSAQDLVLIRADVATATASLRQAEGAIRQAQRALESLIGTYPGTDRTLASDLPNVPDAFGVGAPADILRTRPDLQAAERRVQAAYARHEAAVADQKPQLSLSGSLGGSDASLSNLFDPMNIATNLLANVSAPLFDGGLRQSNVDVAQADIDAALATYSRTALNAFEEVENQIDFGTVLKAREDLLLLALEDARQALKFTQFRYESAEVDLLNVLQIQQRVSFIEAQLVSLRRARLVQYLNLSLALGVPPIET